MQATSACEVRQDRSTGVGAQGQATGATMTQIMDQNEVVVIGPKGPGQEGREGREGREERGGTAPDLHMQRVSPHRGACIRFHDQEG